MSIFPKSGARGLQRSVCLKSHNVQKYEIRFTMELNAAKNTYYIKKTSNKSCSELNFTQKSARVHMSISPQVELRGSKDQYVLNLIMYKNGKLDSLWRSMLPKICIM